MTQIKYGYYLEAELRELRAALILKSMDLWDFGGGQLTIPHPHSEEAKIEPNIIWVYVPGTVDGLILVMAVELPRLTPGITLDREFVPRLVEAFRYNHQRVEKIESGKIGDPFTVAEIYDDYEVR